MSRPWPTNTATPPTGWHQLTDTDGTHPMGWFTRAHDGMRIVARAYPTWEDAHWEIPADCRERATDEELDFDEMDIYLNTVFDLAYRGYVFPDADADTASGLVTHSFVNLDFVNGWEPAIGRDQEMEVMLERTLAGLKPTADLMAKHGERERWTAAVRAAGLEPVPYDMLRIPRLWVAPARLSDRVDRHALTAAWDGLIDAEPNRHRRKLVRAAVDVGLSTAFDIDLRERHTTQPGGRLLPSWWDEASDEGLVVLGAVLGYHPATTYAVLAEGYGPVRLPIPPSPAT
jgi:hypothetical protein